MIVPAERSGIEQDKAAAASRDYSDDLCPELENDRCGGERFAYVAAPEQLRDQVFLLTERRRQEA